MPYQGPGFTAPQFPTPISSFANSPFGPNWERPLPVNAEQILQGGDSSSRLNLLIYKTFFNTDGLKLLNQYAADPLPAQQGSFADTKSDLNIYYEYGTAGKLFSNICHVSMNKTLLSYLRGKSSLQQPGYITDSILQAEQNYYSNRVAPVKMSRERLLEAIEWEVETGSAGANIFYTMAMKLLHAAAETIRSSKPIAQNWDASRKDYAPLLNVQDIEALTKGWDALKKKLDGYEVGLQEAATWCQQHIPAIGSTVADIVQAVAGLLHNLAAAVDEVVGVVKKAVKGVKQANAFICGALAELIETAAGIIDFIALLLMLATDQVGRERLLKSIENIVKGLREHPGIIVQKVKEGFEALQQRYDSEQNSDWQIAYNAGEDAVRVFLFVEGIVAVVKLLKNIPKLFTKLKEWVGKAGKSLKQLAADTKKMFTELLSKETKTDELFRMLKRRINKLTGEEILRIKEIKLLRVQLWEKFRVRLRIVDKEPELKSKLKAWNSRRTSPAASFNDVERTMFIRSEVSAYTVEHELYHVKLWYKMTQEFPEMLEGYKALTKLQHEEYVLAQFMKASDKWSIIDLERDLETINDIRSKEYNLPKVDLDYFKNWKLPE